MDPLAVALEINLRGGRGFAVEVDGFVLDDVRLFWLQQEVWEGLGRVRGKGLRELAQSQVVVIYKWEEITDNNELVAEAEAHIRGGVYGHMFDRRAAWM